MIRANPVSVRVRPQPTPVSSVELEVKATEGTFRRGAQSEPTYGSGGSDRWWVSASFWPFGAFVSTRLKKKQTVQTSLDDAEGASFRIS